ncbi:putative adhesin [Gillisia sp. Hel_I_86]|uniref:DUF4097 family beta strand repeat-containing protein n=1 Tax=Gillisia sp. Hel_I_86 TaxID=1249981 RepID=UPI00119BDCAB|nr:DUF4097 family beta strand repeat-containing protein [Gillisia sp. Hel_I_86]TVZ25822.1 putative adhesin [Gillisia sp. Hel_I_86]
MKSLLSILFVCFISIQFQAQTDYSRSLEGIEWVKIESATPLNIVAKSQNKLLIKSNDMKKVPVKAEGLKLVGSGGTDNTGTGFYVAKEGSELIVKNIRKRENEGATLYLPANTNITVKGSGIYSHITISGFTGEIEASTNVVGDIKFTDVTGPITANSSTGNIEVIFAKVQQSSPISISTATGDVDISLPRNTPADVSLSSTMGEIYTNFDLSIPDKDGLKAVSSQKVQGVINKGGVKIRLNSATGNIYLRKQ